MVDMRRAVELQAWIASYNRRVARHAENGEREYLVAADDQSRLAEFFCACGREDCEEILTLTLDEHRFVREQRYRFLVASGHAREADEVVLSTGEYDVVEVKPEYRQIAAEAVGNRSDPDG